ncbi:hypothetical protein [Peribacillus huizhouensis]|uniref:DUF3994 domain-containing protein n=1 Tax=Peribacillus huizhouensis TaxID=1501239 RepID=A0ABR6CTC2_9BACI|nr:hypothetical protein [Peribacillus huizhouensis]MBA9027597.1 hypothetical protein [Peribacillus huizhouensis]
MQRNFLFIILGISLVILSGCGASSKDSAKKVVESIEEKDYFTAKKIYEDATNDSSKEKKDELNKTISKVLLEYIQKDYQEMKADSDKEASFYNSLGKIEEIGISDKALTNKIKSYKQELEALIEKEDGINEEEVVAQEESTENTYENTIFNMDWKTFSNYWNESVDDYDNSYFMIKNERESQIPFGIRYDGQVNNSLYVSASTEKDTGKVSYAVVIGNVTDNKSGYIDVYQAGANLILIADPKGENKEQIAINYLGLSNGKIVEEKTLSYTQNGIIYKAEYEDNVGSLPTLTVSVEKEKPFGH